jgi:alkylated DNA repair dioxygenase AlkB
MLLEISGVNGFYIIPNVFTSADSDMYYEELNKSEVNECKQIHKAREFGWKFIPCTEKETNVCIPRTKSDNLGELPDFIKNMWKKAYVEILKYDAIKINKNIGIPDHVLINTYPAGDGCSSHTDEIKFWEEWVIGCSFGSGCTFTLKILGQELSIYLPPNSVYIMLEDARYKWKHGITFSNKDDVYGDMIERKERISYAFRNITKNLLPENND